MPYPVRGVWFPNCLPQEGGDRMKHYRKMKRRQRAYLCSIGRKRDIARRQGDVGQRRGSTGGRGEGKGRRRCQLGCHPTQRPSKLLSFWGSHITHMRQYTT
jgi:hypothetical protein